MQLVLVRHALPRRSESSADPDLDELGVEQSCRVPDALARFTVSRVVSSSQQRAIRTAQPLAERLGLEITTDDRLTEYDRDFGGYVPIEAAKTEFRDAYDRIKAGHLPEQVDEQAFRRRVLDGVDDIVSAAAHSDTVVLFAHGGVVNMLLQDILQTPKVLGFPIDYCSVTRVLFSRSGARSVSSVNETAHVWDLLPRNRQSTETS
ncbi:MAG: histidine phosphatase family protein [Rhodococcus sp.]|jgi:broad specificity phosphatase PhoE|uniref:histidine phosphatase family protein n=1 Tax=Nocardiaceae TaxID=85025 RepID=UPI00050C2033|nr:MULTISPECIES: histidine phosphatase family protein [Rhodococcus]MBJ7349512.1 histidine phosphatase family protein [Rhodococcus sp. (in: high G+C Gram-positive bacteria)]KJV02218.1 phosphoglycerate/bisphosphoglycerate mutase [Rhodococcus sp. PML026]MBW4779969.1 histidine phosphatase family protein [Rhodococcus fascians]MBX5333508.1 histidine phosphatase family protein [Rhodococcus fascians]MBY4060691.1 histidine phosphatase family protein [Rhodococcus fascians]